MSEATLYSIVAAPEGHAIRLGWVSSTTGITYCGICLRSPLKPCVGELCENCGACVVGVFNPAAGTQAIRRAWSHVSASAAPLNRSPEPVPDRCSTH